MSVEEEARPQRRKLPRPPKPQLPQEPEMTVPGQTVASNLSAQLGSDALWLSQGQFDMRRLSNLDDGLVTALAYFSWRGGGFKIGAEGTIVRPRRGVRFWAHIVDSYLNLPISKNGLGRRQLIEMQRAALGTPPPLEPERPGWLARNLTDRNWSKKEERY